MTFSTECEGDQQAVVGNLDSAARSLRSGQSRAKVPTLFDAL